MVWLPNYIPTWAFIERLWRGGKKIFPPALGSSSLTLNHQYHRWLVSLCWLPMQHTRGADHILSKERRHCDKTVLLRPKCNPSRATSIKLHGHNRNNNTMCLTSHTATLTSSGERAPMVIPKGCRWLRAPNGADHR